MSLEKERIAVIIGKSGETKKMLEEKTGTKITINSESGEYLIEFDPNAKMDELNEKLESPEVRIYSTDQIIKAINYGFNPLKALKLVDAENIFDLIDLEDVLGHSDKKLTRIRGRLIGEEGKIRSAIEQFARVDISIYKKYLAMIGSFESMKIAKKAINMLMQGAPHKAVLNYLHKEYEEQKREDMKSLWKPTL